MKRFKSILFVLLLTISLSTTAIAGDISGRPATAPGDISGQPTTAPGDISGQPTTAPGDISGRPTTALGDISGFLTWGDIAGVISTIFRGIR
jgi:hypothetical protein